MSDHIEATKAELKTASTERLRVLKRATKMMSMPDIKTFCQEVGASESELTALILDRAAQDGILPKSNLIKFFDKGKNGER